MIILGNFLAALAIILKNVFFIAEILIFLRVISSWMGADPYNQFNRILFNITEPILAPFRRIIPPIQGIDISPIFLLILISFLDKFLVTTLIDYSNKVKFSLDFILKFLG